MRQILACQAHRNTATLLPAVLLCEKPVVLRSSRICRILPVGNSRSAGKTEVCRPDLGFGHPRPAVLLAKIDVRSASFDFPRTSPTHRTRNSAVQSANRTNRKRENRLSAVFTDQAERTVARPHHIMTMPKPNHTDATQPQYPRSQ